MIPKRMGIIFQIPFKKTMAMITVIKVIILIAIIVHTMPMLDEETSLKFKYASLAALEINPHPIKIMAGPTTMGGNNFLMVLADFVKYIIRAKIT